MLNKCFWEIQENEWFRNFALFSNLLFCLISFLGLATLPHRVYHSNVSPPTPSNPLERVQLDDVIWYLSGQANQEKVHKTHHYALLLFGCPHKMRIIIGEKIIPTNEWGSNFWAREKLMHSLEINCPISYAILETKLIFKTLSPVFCAQNSDLTPRKKI